MTFTKDVLITAEPQAREDTDGSLSAIHLPEVVAEAEAIAKCFGSRAEKHIRISVSRLGKLLEGKRIWFCPAHGDVSIDTLVRTVRPHVQHGKLQLIVLTGCCTVRLGRALIESTNIRDVVCWETVVADDAARCFGVAFAEAVALQACQPEVDVADAFDVAQVAIQIEREEGQLDTGLEGLVQKYDLVDPLDPKLVNQRGEPNAGRCRTFPGKPRGRLAAGVPKHLHGKSPAASPKRTRSRAAPSTDVSTISDKAASRLRELQGIPPDESEALAANAELIALRLQDGHTMECRKYPQDHMVRKAAKDLLLKLPPKALKAHAPQIAHCLTLQGSNERDAAVVTALSSLGPETLAQLVPELIQHRSRVDDATGLAMQVRTKVSPEILAARFLREGSYGARALEELSKNAAHAEDHAQLLADAVTANPEVGRLKNEQTGQAIVKFAHPRVRAAMQARLKQPFKAAIIDWMRHRVSKGLYALITTVLGLATKYLLPDPYAITCRQAPALAHLVLSNCSGSK